MIARKTNMINYRKDAEVMIIIKYKKDENEIKCETSTEFWAALVTIFLKADYEIVEVKLDGKE